MLRNLSIQSKLILMLLLVSLASISIIGYLGYVNAREALTKSVSNQLTGIRESKANLVRQELDSLKQVVLTLGDSSMVRDAALEFREAYLELEKKPVEPEWDRKLEEFYRTVFLPGLKENLDAEPVLEQYLPAPSQSRYLQYLYIAANPAPYYQKAKLDAADDGSRYSQAHRRLHPFFRGVTEKFGFDDLMLVDATSGEVVYAAQKTTEFATNLKTGPYAESNLADLFRRIDRSMDRGEYRFADFDFYRPTLGEPASFVATPVFDGPKMVAVLVLQFPIDRIVKAITGGFNWEREGLGKTGEVYLVGSDQIMRTRSRFVYQKETREATLAKLRANRVPASVVDRIAKRGSVVLLLEVDTPAVRAGLSGKQGVTIQPDYRGDTVLSSYAPLDFEGLRWAILAEMDIEEAFAPIRQFGRGILSWGLGLVLGVTILSGFLVRRFLRPIHRVIAAAQRISRGEENVHVRVDSGDEFRQLAVAFNDMSKSLRKKNQQIQEKIREHEDLLMSILPSPIANKVKAGEARTSDSFADVSVLYADLGGLDGLEQTMSEDRVVELVNEVFSAFDEAAEQLGVERVKTLGSSYLAVCGLSVPRLDHVNRIIEFGQQLVEVVRRINRERGTSLSVTIGVNAGPVVGSIMGRNKYLYDLWGDTVKAARTLQGAGTANVVRVSQAVYERVRSQYEFKRDVSQGASGEVSAWTVAG